MSGPIREEDARRQNDAAPAIEVREGRITALGGLGIARVLPTKGRRTIGPWCFVDLMTPADVENPPPMEIGPHPHIGLSTVTWLFEGTALHGDSLGTEQLIRPGQLNLMTAGAGIAHAELGVQPTGPGRRAGDFSGAQMWIAQPDPTRHGPSAFQHVPELPTLDLRTGTASVLVGTVAGATSPAVVDTPTVGLDVEVRPAVELPADPAFEYGVIPIDRTIRVGDALVSPGSLAIVPPGRDRLRLAVDRGAGRALVIGGEPFGTRIQMWWNFVARTRDELAEAWRDWQSHNEDRFGPVPSTLPRMEAPPPPWVRND